MGKIAPRALSSRRNSIRLEIRTKRFGDEHAAIRLLMSFDQCDKQPCERRAAAVEDVRKLVFASFALKLQIHPSRLEVLAIRAARYFQILTLARRPDLDIVGQRARESHVASAK